MSTGYSHSSPSTDGGRAFLCIFALMGIPLLVVWLITIGKYLSGVWDRLLGRISCNRFLTSKHKDTYSFLILAVIGFGGIVLIPAFIFTIIENQWSYKIAVYFAIVSLTTMGFGEFMPAPRYLTQGRYIAIYLIWLFFGFTIMATILTKLSDIYTAVNESSIALFKRCFYRCLKIRPRDRRYQQITELNAV